MSYLFISYAAKDRDIALRIRERLKGAGIETWMDVDLKSGQDLVEAVREALRNASSGLVLLSPAIVNSPEVASEYKTILSQNKRLNVALVAPLSSPHDIPYHLQSIGHVDLQWDFETGMRKLIASIKGETPRSESQKEMAPAAPSRDRDEALVELREAVEDAPARATRQRASVKLEVNLDTLDDAKTKTLIELVTKLTEAGIEEIRVVDVNVG